MLDRWLYGFNRYRNEPTPFVVVFRYWLLFGCGRKRHASDFGVWVTVVDHFWREAKKFEF